jgi:hypothetical protein
MHSSSAIGSVALHIVLFRHVRGVLPWGGRAPMSLAFDALQEMGMDPILPH